MAESSRKPMVWNRRNLRAVVGYEGITLAREVKVHLPYWVVVLNSEFDFFKKGSGKKHGVILSDGSFADFSPEVLHLQSAIWDDDRYD
jgi:hypothetical protein